MAITPDTWRRISERPEMAGVDPERRERMRVSLFERAAQALPAERREAARADWDRQTLGAGGGDQARLPDALPEVGGRDLAGAARVGAAAPGSSARVDAGLPDVRAAAPADGAQRDGGGVGLGGAPGVAPRQQGWQAPAGRGSSVLPDPASLPPGPGADGGRRRGGDGRDSAWSYSVDRAQQLIGSGIESTGRLIGSGAVERAGGRMVEQQERDIEAGGYQPTYPGGFRETLAEQGVADAAGWIGEKIAENWATTGAGIVGGITAIATAPLSAPAALTIGAGTLGTQYLMSVGEVAGEIDERGGRQNDVVAALGAAGITALDRLGLGRWLPKAKLAELARRLPGMTGKELVDELESAGAREAAEAVSRKITEGANAARRGLLARTGRAAGAEALTEPAQDAIAMGAAALQGGERYTPGEVVDRLIDAAVVGGAMGGAVGSVAGARFTPEQERARALQDPDATPRARLEAARVVGRELRSTSPALGRAFVDHAMRAIAAGRPVVAPGSFYEQLRPQDKRAVDADLAQAGGRAGPGGPGTGGGGEDGGGPTQAARAVQDLEAERAAIVARMDRDRQSGALAQDDMAAYEAELAEIDTELEGAREREAASRPRPAMEARPGEGQTVRPSDEITGSAIDALEAQITATAQEIRTAQDAGDGAAAAAARERGRALIRRAEEMRARLARTAGGRQSPVASTPIAAPAEPAEPAAAAPAEQPQSRPQSARSVLPTAEDVAPLNAAAPATTAGGETAVEPAEVTPVDQGQPAGPGPVVEASQIPSGRELPSRPTGRQATTTTPAGRAVDVEYRLVEAGDLVASNDDSGAVNPQYPAELQPRDRSRTAATAQVDEMSRRINPALLGDSPTTTDGAPIVAPDGVVESGNGRTLALRRAYRSGRGDGYRQWLAGQGFDVQGMAEPVLVRVRQTPMTPEERVEYARESNERTTLEMSATEQAAADAEMVRPILSEYQGGDIASAANAAFARKFIGGLSGQGARGGMIDAQGLLSQDGRRRIEAALLAAAYGDPALVEDVFESADTEIKAIGGALLDAAGRWATMREAVRAGATADGLDVTEHLIAGVNLIRRARSEGRRLSEMVGTDDILAGRLDPMTEAFLRIFYRTDATGALSRARGRDKVADALMYYADQALQSQPGEGLLGDPLTAERLMRGINERFRGQEQGAGAADLLAAGRADDGRDAGPPGRQRQRSGPEAESRPDVGGAQRGERSAESAEQRSAAATDTAGQQAQPEEEGSEAVEPAAASARGDVDAAANEAATSPTNDAPPPTEAQIEAGNYKKGHVSLHGLDISIENPAGSVREGVDRDGKPWRVRMAHHYGYVRRYGPGRDGDHVDVFIGPNPDSTRAFIIDQVNPDSRRFDEHKIMLGFDTQAEAEAGYLANYAPGWQGLGATAETDIDGLKQFLGDGDLTRRAAPQVEAGSAPTAAATGGQQKIDDFGEVLAGARKHYAAEWAERMREVADSNIGTEPLSKSWPEPNYAKLLEGGADPWTVAFVHAARDEVPSKPRQSWKLKRWVAQVATLRQMAGDLLSGDGSAAKLRERLAEPEYQRLADAIGSRIDLYQAVGHEKSLKGVRIASGTYSMLNGVEYKPPKVLWTVERKAKASSFSNWPTLLSQGDTREAAIEAFKRAYGRLEVQPKAEKQVSFSIYSYRSDPKQAVIGKKVGRNYIDLKTFDSTKEARDYLAGHQAELEALLAKHKEIPSHRKESNSPRVGVDHRNGADVTPAQFAETFGFRGVQFGNYVEGPRRQQDLNQAYDALLDMAGVLELPPAAMSLNGELGLAFGARGQGGKRAAAAHYEPKAIVINLTKREGAGSLAHEWWHAIDNYFSRARGRRDEYMTERPDGGDGVRAEMREAFRAVHSAVMDSALRERSRRLDRKRTKQYWSTGREMTARAFESFIIEKLQDQGQANDYLANIVSQEYWDAATALGLEEGGTYPYPEAAEIPRVRAAFEGFFRTVETRETDRGTTEIREDQPPRTAARQRPAEAVSERGDGGRQGQLDLFVAPGESKREAYSDLYGTVVKARTVSYLRAPSDKLTSAEDAATLFAAIRKGAQESLFVAVTDAQGKILRVMRHTKGSNDASAVYPLAVVAEAASIPGAARLFLAHNHPTGDPGPSKPDWDITQRIIQMLDGTGLEFAEHVVIGQSSWAAVEKDGTPGTAAKLPLTPSKRTESIPVTERFFGRRDTLSESMSSPIAMAAFAEPWSDALVLLNTRHRVVAVVPMTPSEMETLREGGRVNRILGAIDKSNAVAVVIKTDSSPAARNLARFFNSLQHIRLLDWINAAGVSDASGSQVTRWAGGPFASRGRKTINVDGVDRPTQNSDGQPIHPTEEGIRSFWRWFSGSAVVDDQGRPIQAYHGTTADFDAFDMARAGRNDHGWYGNGFYLSADPETASAYANHENIKAGGKLRDKPRGAKVMPAYVALKNPYIWPNGRAAATTEAERDAIMKELKSAGHDGVIVPNEYQSPAYADFHEIVAFRPEQIKSAIGNQGTFDPSDPDIRRSAGQRPDPGLSAADVEAAIDQEFGPRVRAGLGDALVVPDTAESLRADMEARGSAFVGMLFSGGERPTLDLEQQTAADVQAQEAAYRAARRGGKTPAEREAERRADADRERGDFELTGSDRPADANPRQGGLFSREGGALSDVRGFYDPSTDTSYILPWNISSAEDARGVLLHEVGVHYGMERMLGEKAYAGLVTDLELAARAGGERIGQALRDVNDAEGLGLNASDPQFRARMADLIAADPRVAQEVMGYLVENHPGLRLSERILGAIRAFLRRLGVRGKLDDATLVSLARAAVRRGKIAGLPVDGGERQVVTASRAGSGAVTDTPGFRRWFGNSVVTDNGEPASNGGKPLVVYHGTVGALDGGAFRPDAGDDDAVFFTSDPEIASNVYARGLAEPNIDGIRGALSGMTDDEIAALADRLRGRWRSFEFSFEDDAGGAPYADQLLDYVQESFDELEGSGQAVDRLAEALGVQARAPAPAANVIPAYLSLENPLVIDGARESFDQEQQQAWLDEARAGGHDGLIIRDYDDGGFGVGENFRSAGRHTVYVAFRPEQIQSAFDRDNANILASGQPVSPWYYSALARVVDDAKQAKATADQWLALLRKSAIKAEEIEWLGVEQWLAEQPGKTVAKADLAQFIAANQLQINDVVLEDEHGLAVGERARSAFEADWPLRDWLQETIDEEMTKAWDDPRHRVWPALSITKDEFIEAADGNVSEALADFRDSSANLDPTDVLGANLVDILKEEAWSQFGPRYRAEAADAQREQDMQAGVDAGLPGRAAAFRDYTLPGGSNYREVLLTLPDAAVNTEPSARFRVRFYDETGRDRVEYATMPQVEAFRSRGNRADVLGPVIRRDESANFRSSHFTEPNILVHARTKDWVDVDGRSVLAVMEVQSDWHQRGRKEGYVPRKVAQAKQRLKEEQYTDEDLRVLQEFDDERGFPNAENQGLPDAPFKKTWAALGMKRLLRMAAENGFDAVAWPADADTVAAIEGWTDLQQVDGRWVLGRGRQQDVTPIINRYLQDIPRELAKYARKLGGEMGKSTIDSDGKRIEMNAIAITPEMRASVMRGQPLFSRQRSAGPDILHHGQAAGKGMLPRPLRLALAPTIRTLDESGYTVQVVATFDLLPDAVKTGIGGVVDAGLIQDGATFYAVADAIVKPSDIRQILEGAPGVTESGTPEALGRLSRFAKAVRSRPAGPLRKAFERALSENRLAVVTRRQLADLGGRYLPELRRYLAQSQRMDGERNTLLAESATLADRWLKWGRKNRAANEALVDLMHDATIAGVDPAVAYAPLITEAQAEERIAMLREQARGRSGESTAPMMAKIDETRALLAQERNRERSAPALMERWAALPEPAKELYRNVRDAYVQRDQAWQQALLSRIADAIPDAERRSAVMDRLRVQFESQRVPKPYFPLARAGDYWVSVRDAAGEVVEYRMFESEMDWNNHVKAMEAVEGYQVAYGKNVRQFLELDGVAPGFVAEVEALVDDPALQDEIWQAYLRTLPDLSVRQHFIHRKKTPGYDRDAVRSFSNQMFHGGYQLARLKWSHKMQGTLDRMEEDIGYAADDARVAELERRVPAGEKAAESLRSVEAELREAIERGGAASRTRKDLADLAADDEDWRAQFTARRPDLDRDIKAGREARKRLDALRETAAAGQDAARRLREVTAIRQNRAFAADLLTEMKRRHQWAMNPKGGALANYATSFGFGWFLGVSPAAALVNITQVPLVALPMMGAKYGYGAASRELSRAYVNYARGGAGVKEGFFSIRKSLQGDEAAAYDQWVRDGVLDKTLAHDLAGMSEQGLDRSSAAHGVMSVVSWSFHKAELANREITAIATYRLARQRGATHSHAVAMAENMVWDSQFDYSTGNKARVMQSDTAKVLLLFRQFAQNMTYVLARTAWVAFSRQPHYTAAERSEARKTLAGIFGMTGVAAGVTGLPIYPAVAWAVQAALDDEDDPIEADQVIRQWMASVLGDDAADLVAKGAVNKAAGIDLASRVSLANLWWHEDYRDREGRAAGEAAIVQAAGPVFAAMIDILYAGPQLWADGHGARALEKMSPKFVRDIVKGGRFVEQGVTTLRGDPLLEDVAPSEIAGQVVGFTPARLAERYEQNSALKKVEQRILGRRRDLLDHYALAHRLGDAERREELVDTIARFNAANPEVAIRPETIRRSLRGRAQASAETAQGIRLNARLRQRLLEGVVTE